MNQKIFYISLLCMMAFACSEEDSLISLDGGDQIELFQIKGTICADSMTSVLDFNVGENEFDAASVQHYVSIPQTELVLPAISSAIHNTNFGAFSSNYGFFEGMVFTLYGSDTLSAIGLDIEEQFFDKDELALILEEGKTFSYSLEAGGMDLQIVNYNHLQDRDTLNYGTAQDPFSLGSCTIISVENYSWIPSDGQIHEGFRVKMQFGGRLLGLIDSGGINYNPIYLEIKNGEANLVFEY